jgi:SAM-dependent methyltransferase
VSQDLLDHCRALAGELGALDRCAFVRAPAEDLAPIADGSVDVVTTRSVLIYVKAKEQTFREFHRVLRAGGRLSIWEPINRFANARSPDRFWEYDVAPVREIAQKVRAVYERQQPPDADPMLDFDERDLFALAEAAGFRELHLDYRARVTETEPGQWDQLVRVAPNPRVPTLEEAMTQALAPEERERFAAHVRPLVEAGQGTLRWAAAYLWAVKR